MYLGSNYTAREAFHIRGYLTAEEQQCMVEDAEDVETMRATVPNIEEARGCYPSEDFAENLISAMRDLSKRMRGDTKAVMLELIEQAEKLQTEVVQEGEYGASELQNALNVLEAY